MARKEVSYRKINKIDLDELSQDIKFDASYYNNNTIDELVFALDKTLKEALDKHSPGVQRIVTARQKTLWFNQQVIGQKRLVRERDNRVNNITGGVKENPLPECKDDKCLADTFAD